jgi:hypothetical protein
MRSAALELSWYQYFLLDVIAVLALAAGSLLLTVFLVVRAVLRKVLGRKASEIHGASKRKKQN